MKKKLHIIPLLLIFICALVNVSHAQRGKVYRSMESALVNPDSVFVLYLTIDKVGYIKGLEELINLDTLLLFSMEHSPNLPEWFFEIPCIQNLSHLTLPSNLKKYPKGLNLLTQLKSLDISGNEELFKEFPQQLLELKKLEYLDLTNCGLGRSDKSNPFPNDFQKLVSLKKLNLYNNELESVPEVLSKLISLETLDLKYNNLSGLPESISNLSNLKELILLGNDISTLPESFSNLKNLNYLDLYNNNLSNLPESFSNLSNLKYLDISNNNFNSLPKIILELSELEYLNIDLSQPLPKDFNRLIHLKKLEIALGTDWSHSTSVIYSLKNLEELRIYMSSWMMKDVLFSDYPDFKISDSINMLTNLKVLDISDMSYFNLESLPMGLKYLSNLEEINLSDNPLLFKDSFPEVVTHLTNLQRLHLNGCNITEFPIKLNNLKKITYLRLDNNGLIEIPDFVFSLENLEELYLQKNKLKKVSYDLTQLKNIQKLDLGWNNLTNLPKEMSKLSELEVLWLSYNPITTFPTVINEFTQLKELILDLDFIMNDASIVESGFPLPLKNLEVLIFNPVQLGDEERIKYIKEQMPHLRIYGGSKN